MAKNYTVAGLDIGTNTTKLLVAQRVNGEWESVAYAQMSSFGLRKGAVANIGEVAKIIQLLVSDTERNHNIKISSVFVNIGGNHLYTVSSDGLISVSRADHIISEEDVERVLQATKAVNIPSNEEVLDVFPREFIVDNQKGIKQPVGLTGVRLEAKVTLLCYFQYYFINLTQAVLGAKLQIDDIIPSPIAAAKSVLTPQQKEIGVVLIDMGAATTSMAVFEEGDLIHLAVFPLGSANITNDIAIGFRTEIAVAESIKKQYGSCMREKTDKERFSGESPEDKKKEQIKKKIEISGQTHSLSFTKKDLIDIMEPRVSEILDLMQKELKKIGRQELLPGGVVLTGGGAKLPKIKELAKQRLMLPCEIGIPKGITGVERDPAMATVAGLILGSVEDDNFDEGGSAGLAWKFVKRLISKFGKMFRVFIP